MHGVGFLVSYVVVVLSSGCDLLVSLVLSPSPSFSPVLVRDALATLGPGPPLTGVGRDPPLTGAGMLGRDGITKLPGRLYNQGG